MRSLVAVAEHGTVTQAASKLGVSQSALSRRMDQLEQQLGAPLFQKVGRRVVLTELGRIAASEGALLVRRYEVLKQTLAQRQALQSGRVLIGGGATAVAFLLPGVIADFRRRYPDIVFQLREAGSREIEEAVMNEQLELGVVTLPTRLAGITARALGRDRIVLVAAKDHPLVRAQPVEPRDLRGQSFVGFDADTAIRRLIDSALLSAHVEVNVVMELRSVAAILKMVESTGSLAFVSELSVFSLLTLRHSVVALPVAGLQIRRELALISKTGRPPSAAAASFSEALLATCPGILSLGQA